MTEHVRFLRSVPALGLSESFTVPAGASLADMAEHIGMTGGAAYLRSPAGTWHAVPRERWGQVRPRRDDIVCFAARPGFQLIGAVVSLVTSLTASIGGAFGAIAGFFGMTGTQLLLGVGLTAGRFLLSRLFAPEPQTQSADPDAARSTIENITSDSNMLARDAYLPRVFGQRRLSPPDIVKPHLYMDSGVEAIERLMAAQGPHAISSINVDGTPAGDMANVTTQTRDGQAGTTTNTIVERFTEPAPVGEDLRTFRLESRDLEDQNEPDNSSPVAIRFRTKGIGGMEEVTIRLSLQAMVKTIDPTVNVRVPFRIRWRPEGGGSGDWVNLPEIHLTGIEQGSRFLDIRIRRDNRFGEEDIDGVIDYDFWTEVPEVTAWTLNGVTGTQWEANAAFVSGAGLQDVQNVLGRRDGIRVTATEAVFPEDDFEWEIVRGIVMDESALNASYEHSGNVVSLFAAANEGTAQTPIWRVPVAQQNYQTRLSVTHATAISGEHPCQQPGTALLALRSRGQSIRNVSAVFSGYAKDWDGSGFNNWVETNNPALHTRQLLEDICRHSQVAEYSRLARFKALAQSLLVNTDWTGWKAQCEAMGARASLVASGEPVAETLARLLAAGLARPSFGPQLRIDYFRDRSAETPVLTFSPRNARIRVAYEYSRRPMGVRAKFRNRLKDWAEDEIEVRAPITGNTPNWQRVEMHGIDDPDWLTQRVTFDMLRAHYWRTLYEVETPIEGMALKPGSLVGIVTDLVDDRAHGARVRAVPDPQILEIDQIIPASTVLEDLDDLDANPSFDFDDLFEVGEQSTVICTTPTGPEMRTIIDAYPSATSGRGTIVVDSPFSSTDLAGAHLSIGSLSNQIRRCIVVEEKVSDEFSKTVICADEAPEIYDHMSNTFGWA